jgi:ABC-type antimicrobial peptide transport system permease subunit
MSYLVSRRTREIGVRIALGATPASIVRLVMADGLGVTAVGMAIGLIAAAVAARGLRSWLFGVQPSDPLTFAGVTLVLTAIATLATYIPARRATAVDPIRAVRTD